MFKNKTVLSLPHTVNKLKSNSHRPTPAALTFSAFQTPIVSPAYLLLLVNAYEDGKITSLPVLHEITSGWAKLSPPRIPVCQHKAHS